MLTLPLFGAVAAGGALGACLRYAVTEWLSPLEARGTLLLGFPLATLLVNVLGSLLLGLLTGLALRAELGTAWKAFLGAGLLGGFTTFSAFSVQTLVLFDTAPLRAAAYVTLSVGLCVGAAALGRTLLRGLV